MQHMLSLLPLYNQLCSNIHQPLSPSCGNQLPAPLAPPCLVTCVSMSCADPELTVDAMCEILNCVAERWEWLSVSIGTPFDQIENIKKQCEDDPSRCAPTAWGYWLSSHPAPSWALVADALYENMEHDALKLLKLKYPVGEFCATSLTTLSPIGLVP